MLSKLRLLSMLLLAALICSNQAYAKKNVILMISDGQGFNTVKATNMYQGTYNSNDPYKMAGMNFDVSSAMQTNSANNPAGYDPSQMWGNFNYAKSGATDSASAATAMYTGIKNYDGQLNWSTTGEKLTTVFDIAAQKGFATGAVSSVHFSHATPAAVGAHNSSRGNYSAIANEMIYDSGLDVIMGPGHPLYNDNGQSASASYTLIGGSATWADMTDSDGANGFKYMETKADFEALASGTVTSSKYIGLPQVRNTLQQGRTAGNSLNTNVPDLATMSKGALNVLNQDSDGFFVMIEGGAVDWANHANQQDRMIQEQMDFVAAVAAVNQWVETNSSWNDTLLIVTADHECGHLWGPTAGTYNDLVDNGAGVIPGMSFNSGSHTNSLVPFYAKGAGAGYFLSNTIGNDSVYGSYIDNTSVFSAMNNQIPEPATIALLGFGLSTLVLRRNKK